MMPKANWPLTVTIAPEYWPTEVSFATTFHSLASAGRSARRAAALAARSAGLPLWQRLGGDGPEPTPLYRPVQGATPEAAAANAVKRIDQGYRRLQVKVGDDPIVDAQRVLAVRAAVGDDIIVFADANCGFSLSSARRFVRELGPKGAGVFLEQPCATLGDCGRLREDVLGDPFVDVRA